MRRLKFTSCVVALLLAGCAVGPDYQRPPVTAPVAFRGAPPPEGDRSLADIGWWEIYRDKELNLLIRAALVEGYDARLAAARVEQAQAIAAQVHGQRFPALGYAANADRGRNSQLGNAYTQGNGATASGLAASVRRIG